ncbi:hypothetical protein ABZ519_18965 [Streptomyces collinus]|uniref:hypothetical protein n=1 Tax=Streptomyces collinus TaxID=42684 RepID=UPI003404D205
MVPRPEADAIVPAEHTDGVLRLDDPQALQPLALAHRDPAPAFPAAQAFLRLALTRLTGEGHPGWRHTGLGSVRTVVTGRCPNLRAGSWPTAFSRQR